MTPETEMTLQCYGGPQDGNSVPVDPGQAEVVFSSITMNAGRKSGDPVWISVYKVRAVASRDFGGNVIRLVFDGYRKETWSK